MEIFTEPPGENGPFISITISPGLPSMIFTGNREVILHSCRKKTGGPVFHMADHGLPISLYRSKDITADQKAGFSGYLEKEGSGSPEITNLHAYTEHIRISTVHLYQF